MPKQRENPDVLQRAFVKRASGRGTTNTEKKAMADFESGRIGRDHFAQIASSPMAIPETRRLSVGPNQSIDEIDGLRPELRKIREADGGLDGTDLIRLLISSGATFAEFTYCASGTPATAWWPLWASDPTP